MCFKEDDKEQWEDNPIEWILERSDVHAEFMSAEAAAQYLLHTLCKKHPNLIPDILTFTLGQMTPDPARVRQKDGALHFLGIIRTFFVLSLLCYYVNKILPAPRG